jgi:hypothetical protein
VLANRVFRRLLSLHGLSPAQIAVLVAATVRRWIVRLARSARRRIPNESLR